MTVEVTRKYVTTTSDLAAAWAFVLSRVDDLGPNPSIDIHPQWEHDGNQSRRYFEVVVSGTTEEGD